MKLSGCRKLTDATIDVLGRACPYLQTLNLSGISGVSAKAVARLVSSCGLLLSVNISFCDVIAADEAGLNALMGECQQRSVSLIK
jgi:hypothetical protein